MQENKKIPVEELMSLNRKDRRRIAKVIGVKKIPGSTISFVKQKTKDKKGFLHI